MQAARTLAPGTYTTPVAATTTTQTVRVDPPVTTSSTGAVAGAAVAAPVAAEWANASSWCLPFIIYVILAIIGFILLLSSLFSNTNRMSTGNKWVSLIVWLIVLIFFGWLIQYLCRRGHVGWAWFVLFLPLIILVIFWLIVAGLIGAFWAGAEAGSVVRPPVATE